MQLLRSKDFGYGADFQYGPTWYTNVYHADAESASTDDPGPGIHEARDREVLAAAGISRFSHYLVLGCGGLHNVSLLRAMVGEDITLTGIDWSSRIIDWCRKVYPEYEFLNCDIQHLLFPNEAFDVILAMDFTEHLSLEDYALFWRESSRLLQSGGRLVVVPGMTARPEHINVISVLGIASHGIQNGLEVMNTDGLWWVVFRKK